MTADLSPSPTIDTSTDLSAVLALLNQIGPMVRALLDTRILCAACIREQIAAAEAGVSAEHLPPVNIATVIERGEGVCGNHLGGQQPALFLPPGFGR